MQKDSTLFPLVFIALIMSVPALGAHKKPPKIAPTEKVVLDQAPAVLWRDPIDIAQRDLYNGPGGKKDQPHGPFTFEKEDLKGSSPKFVVRDADGVKWKVKLGWEAQPEIAATRLVWAAGYFATEDYLVTVLRVQNMPERLHRGQEFVSPDGSMVDARLKRYLPDEEKAENWKWRNNPFTGTRELNGLRVMMALINNWDLKDINNGVFAEKERPGNLERIYMVNDLGASFATAGRDWPMMKAKGNLDEYNKSRFIRNVTPDYVDFQAPARSSIFITVDLKDYLRRFKLEWIGRHIPRENARWMGQILGRLSPDQIRDAFRAAGYGPGEVEGFTKLVEQRIAQLQDL